MSFFCSYLIYYNVFDERVELYRYGFNGKEKDDEVSGSGNSYDYGFRIYNPRIAKFLSVDPLTSAYPWYTPYQFAGNKPINNIDLDGLEECLAIKEDLNDGGSPNGSGVLQTNSKGVMVPPPPSLDAGMIQKAGFDASRYSFTYVEGSELTEMSGAGGLGFRYEVSYDGRNIGAVYVNAANFVGRPDLLRLYLSGVHDFGPSGPRLTVHADHTNTVEPALEAIIPATNYSAGASKSEIAAGSMLEFIGGMGGAILMVGNSNSKPATTPPSAGEQRANTHGAGWQSASLEKAIDRHCGSNYSSWTTKTGKRIYENPQTGRQVVHDVSGNYFRIFQPESIGSKKGVYLDMLGKVPSPATRVKGGGIKNIALQAGELQKATSL